MGRFGDADSPIGFCYSIIIIPYIIIYNPQLVGGFNHLEKYESVNGKDDIPYIMENKTCLSTNILYGLNQYIMVEPTIYNKQYIYMYNYMRLYHQPANILASIIPELIINQFFRSQPLVNDPTSQETHVASPVLIFEAYEAPGETMGNPDG